MIQSISLNSFDALVTWTPTSTHLPPWTTPTASSPNPIGSGAKLARCKLGT